MAKGIDIERVTVELWLHPLAWHVLQGRMGAFDGVAVDVSHTWVYGALCSSLQRNNIVSASELRRKPAKLQKGKVYIYGYDNDRYGHYVRLSRQAAISIALCREGRERLCHEVAMAVAATGCSITRAVGEILENEGIEEEMLTGEALKKNYLRHYRHLEGHYRQILNTLSK